MKKLLIVALIAVVAASGFYLSNKPQPQSSQPQKHSQEIYIVYSQMDVAEAMALQCEQVGSTSSYVCPLIGAGGGHAMKD